MVAEIILTEQFLKRGYNIQQDVLANESSWKLITKKEEETVKGVYHYYSFIIKKLNSCDSCLRHEFMIGRELNNLGLPYFPLTYAYVNNFNDSGSELLIIEYINLNYSVVQKKHLKQILYTIADIQSRTPFTHYDLHLGNIGIIELKYATEKKYNCFGEIRTLVTRQEVKILDFGYSHLSLVTDDWVEMNMGTIMNGSIPSVFDDLFDLSVIYSALMIFEADTAATNDVFSLLKENRMAVPRYKALNSWEILFNSGLYPGRDILFHLYDGSYYSFIMDIYGDEDRFYSTADTTDLTLLKFNEILGKEYSSTNTTINKITVNKYSKILGAVLHKHKLEHVNKRSIPTKQIFEMMIKSLD